MPLPQNIDLDRLVKQTLEYLAEAVHGWLGGQPHDEVALMNRITEVLNRKRKRCDVGLYSPVTMVSDLSFLHRKGDGQVDQYGSDLAITVRVLGDPFVKTALFQLKRSKEYSCEIDVMQLVFGQRDPRIAERAFVVAADEERRSLRLKKSYEVLADCDISHRTTTLSSHEWLSVTEWLERWLRCDLGPASDPHDPKSVESLLEQYLVEPFLVDERSEIAPISSDYLPVRAWLRLLFRPFER